MRSAEQTEFGDLERTDVQATPSAVDSLRAWAHRAWLDAVGPRGWRSIAGPAIFAVVAIALLLYDHLQQRVPHAIFWLGLGLIATVFARMVETNRKQSEVLEQHQLGALSDRVTGLRNRLQLEADIGAALTEPQLRSVLMLLDFDGLQTYNDRFGYAAGDDLVRKIASKLIDAAAPLGGTAYRIEGCRLAMLVPAREQQASDVVLAATASLRNEGNDPLIGWSYGEVTIPDEAADPELAIQVASQRLSAHNQRQHRSARRQAHAVLMAVLGSRRPELREHLRVVTYRAIALGRRFGLTREEIDDIALAAELQDIGLLSVPEAILEKESPLTEEELTMIRSRSLAGEKIIGAAPGLASVASLVRSSSEYFDGSGYPDGLAGDSIPLGARIIAVAVAFAAMTAPRPYRSTAGTFEDALTELRRCSGTQFDPKVVDALVNDLTDEIAATTAPVARQTVS